MRTKIAIPLVVAATVFAQPAPPSGETKPKHNPNGPDFKVSLPQAEAPSIELAIDADKLALDGGLTLDFLYELDPLKTHDPSAWSAKIASAHRMREQSIRGYKNEEAKALINEAMLKTAMAHLIEKHGWKRKQIEFVIEQARAIIISSATTQTPPLKPASP
ncbi:MAG: hypothetical protein L6Q57_08970 [Alphaproteobacteria bacterium]|nr:hypothetical protein [Alphaproteobacteria bacterium]